MADNLPDAPTASPGDNEQIPAPGKAPVPTPIDESTVTAPAGPRHIGPYRLIQKAGEGGMGEVWHAEQTEPIRRRVALKIIKQGMDTRQVIARFEVERQALALMDHPCVAKVFDAGTTTEGRPYFVMEYVQGLPITDHCDRQKLSTQERLALFTQVCDGVQHAHHKAIIHRDLKPSNVLVTIQEDKAVPKIIDFGVAKATAQRLTEKSLFTELGVLIGTPEYMSPEQADLTAQDVDTRTDVYSLGVILYELLMGALPFEPKDLRRGGLEGIRRMIHEMEPPRPSTRLSTLGAEKSTDSARHRRVDVSTLRRQLSGDLDWITMKALEKDRSRRYGSPADLAADIGRHLSHEPVVAGPPSTTYRLGKFVRRHRFGVAAAAVGVVALAVVAVVMGMQVRRTAQERQRAEQVSRFLTSLFTSANPWATGGKEVSLRQVLDQGADRIDKEVAGEPEVQANLLHTIGEVYLWLGQYDEAERLLTRAVELRRRLLGDDHPDTLMSESTLGGVYQRQGRHAEEERIYQEVLAARRRVLGEDHPDTLWSMNNFASALHNRGRYAEAEAMYRETLEKRRRVSGEDHPDTLWLMANLAAAIGTQGRYAEAEALHREVLERRRRVLGEDHPDTLGSMHDVASTMQSQGRYADAEALHRDVLERQRRVLGEDHPDTLGSMHDVATAMRLQGRYADAEVLFREVLERRRRVLGEDHPDTLGSMHDVATALRLQGRHADAEALSREVLERRRRVLGEDHTGTLSSMQGVANSLADQGRYVEAEPLHREVLERRRRVLGEDHLDTLRSMVNFANDLLAQGRFVEAEPLYREGLEKQRRVLGEDNPGLAGSMILIANSLARHGRYVEAEPLQREALELRRRVLGEDHPDVGGSMYNLGCLASLRGERANAIDWLKQAVAHGFSDGKWMAEDAELKSLHGDPAFEAIVIRARKNHERVSGTR